MTGLHPAHSQLRAAGVTSRGRMGDQSQPMTWQPHPWVREPSGRPTANIAAPKVGPETRPAPQTECREAAGPPAGRRGPPGLWAPEAAGEGLSDLGLRLQATPGESGGDCGCRPGVPSPAPRGCFLRTQPHFLRSRTCLEPHCLRPWSQLTALLTVPPRRAWGLCVAFTGAGREAVGWREVPCRPLACTRLATSLTRAPRDPEPLLCTLYQAPHVTALWWTIKECAPVVVSAEVFVQGSTVACHPPRPQPQPPRSSSGRRSRASRSQWPFT